MNAMSGMGAGVALASLLTTAVAACGAEPPGPTDGDCNIRITFKGNTFRSHNLVNAEAPPDPAVLGTGNTVGCDKKPIDQVAIHKVRGIDPRVAIAVTEPDGRGLYIREGTSPKDWPALVKTSTVTAAR